MSKILDWNRQDESWIEKAALRHHWQDTDITRKEMTAPALHDGNLAAFLREGDFLTCPYLLK
jgi:hypothetical protein